MVTITLNKTEYKLRFSHIAMKSLEKYYGMNFQKIFNEIDYESIDNIGVFVWAMTQRYHRGTSLEQIEEVIDDGLENGEVTYEELGEKIQETLENSQLYKEQKEEAKNKKGA